MRRAGRWFITGWALVGILTGSTARGQQVEADPPDAYARVRGPVTVSGDFPLSVSEMPPGKYGFEAGGLGLATSRGHLRRDENGLSLQSWASALSLLQPPGLAHLVRDDSRGWIHLGAGLTSGAFIALGHFAMQDAQDRVDAAYATIDTVTTAGGLAEAGIDLLAGLAEKDDEHRVRNLWVVYLGAAWLGAGLEASFFNPSPAIVTQPDGQRVLVLPRASRWGAVARSLLVPGAGQRYLGKSARANLFSSLVAATAAGAIAAQDRFLEARRDDLAAQRRLEAAVGEDEVRRAESAADDAAADRDTWNTIRWTVTGAAATIYLWNVFDAFFGGGSAQGHAPPVTVAATPNGVALQLTFGFR